MANPLDVSPKRSRRRRWRDEDALRILELWPRSELSLAAFARENGVDPRRLYWGKTKVKQRPAATQFQEVRLDAQLVRDAALEVVLRSGITHWEPPLVVTLVIATSGRFTADGVRWVEQHNLSGKRPRVELWPESHLERLLARRPHLVASFKLR